MLRNGNEDRIEGVRKGIVVKCSVAVLHRWCYGVMNLTGSVKAGRVGLCVR